MGIGIQTLNNNITGSSNVAVGYQSLFNTTGSNNTALGYSAGSSTMHRDKT